MLTASRVVYWAAAIVGALVVFWLVHRSTKTEAFGVQGGAEGAERKDGSRPPAPVVEGFEDARDQNYVEKLDSTDTYWPVNEASIVSYMSSFSQQTKYGQPTYDAQRLLWRDMKKESMGFKVVSQNTNLVLPSSIKSFDESNTVKDMGMSLKDLKLLGPSSQEFGTESQTSSSIVLPSFTMCMYGVIESLDFPEGNQRIVVFQISAEHPYVVQLAISRRDSRTAMLEVVLGKKVYKWPIEKNTLMANRVATMYGVVYDKDAEGPVVKFHIGGSVYKERVIDTEPILLGNTEAVINPKGQFDMKMLAFGFFNTPLSDESMKKMHAYFTRQQSGIDIMLQKQKEDYLALQEDYEKKIQDATRTLESVEDELSKCKEATEKALAAAPKTRHWQITMEQGTESAVAAKLTPEDLKKCTPLKVASKVAASAAAGTGTAGAASAGAATASTSTTSRVTAPPASASDPSASLEERVRDALAQSQ